MYPFFLANIALNNNFLFFLLAQRRYMVRLGIHNKCYSSKTFPYEQSFKIAKNFLNLLRFGIGNNIPILPLFPGQEVSDTAAHQKG